MKNTLVINLMNGGDNRAFFQRELEKASHSPSLDTGGGGAEKILNLK